VEIKGKLSRLHIPAYGFSGARDYWAVSTAKFSCVLHFTENKNKKGNENNELIDLEKSIGKSVIVTGRMENPIIRQLSDLREPYVIVDKIKLAEN
jgi:hypothetical protein